MYYYGGYQGYGGYPSGGCCGNQGGYGTGYGAAIILVLFILFLNILYTFKIKYLIYNV